VQDVYDYIFAIYGVDPPFKVYTAFPTREEIPCEEDPLSFHLRNGLLVRVDTSTGSYYPDEAMSECESSDHEDYEVRNDA